MCLVGKITQATQHSKPRTTFVSPLLEPVSVWLYTFICSYCENDLLANLFIGIIHWKGSEREGAGREFDIYLMGRIEHLPDWTQIEHLPYWTHLPSCDSFAQFIFFIYFFMFLVI